MRGGLGERDQVSAVRNQGTDFRKRNQELSASRWVAAKGGRF
jgi:hypothetical protein